MAQPLGDSDYIELMVKAAELYYELGLTQEEVAAHLAVSRPTVSRLLRQAREQDIVRITIVNPKSRAVELERSLVEQWGLHDAVVVPTTIARGELLLQRLGEAGACYLERHLPHGATLGIGLGRTVYKLVHALDCISPSPKVVPLCGGTVFSESAYHVNEIARIAAKRLHGWCYYLHAPAEASSRKVYEALLADTGVAEVLRMWDELNWAVVGVGSAEHAESPEFRAYVERTANTGAQPVADLCHRLVDADGRTCTEPTESNIIAVTIDQLRRAERVVAVAGGPQKVRAIVAALRTGAIDVLLTDETTALGLIRAADQAAAGDSDDAAHEQ